MLARGRQAPMEGIESSQNSSIWSDSVAFYATPKPIARPKISQKKQEPRTREPSPKSNKTRLEEKKPTIDSPLNTNFIPRKRKKEAMDDAHFWSQKNDYYASIPLLISSYLYALLSIFLIGFLLYLGIAFALSIHHDLNLVKFEF